MYLTEPLDNEKQQNEISIYYFCRHGEPMQNTAGSILRGLLYQIFKAHPLIDMSAWFYLDGDARCKQTSSYKEALWLIFKNLIADHHLGRIFCVIDGLDECIDDTNEFLLPKLLNLCTTDTKTELRVAITSRPLYVLNKALTTHLDRDHVPQVKHDVQAFIILKVNDLCQTHQFDSEFGTEVRNFLRHNAEDSILWVALVMKQIMQLSTATEIRFAMKGIPSGLPGLYKRMLYHVIGKHAQFAKEVAFLLHCVVLVKRPLSLQALCVLMAPDVVYQGSLIRGQDRIRDLVAMSGGILELQSAGDDSDVFVAVVHQSARNYLVTELDPKFQGFCVDEDIIHLKIAQRCLTCLEHNWVEAGRPHFEATKIPVHRDQADLVDYTLEFWHYHARHCGRHAAVLFDLRRPFFGFDLNVRMYWMYSGLGGNPPEEVVGLDLSQANFLWNQNQLSAIHVACLLGNVPWLESLVNQPGTDIMNMQDGFGVTPMQYACLGGHAIAVEMIMDRVDKEQYSRGLWFAIIAGSMSIARLLVDKGANFNFHCETNQNLIDLACDGDDDDDDIIKRKGQKSISLLLKAIEGCHPDIVRILLDKHANLWPNGESAVQYADNFGDKESYHLLVKHSKLCQH
jgi:ankyrin repeat protein